MKKNISKLAKCWLALVLCLCMAFPAGLAVCAAEGTAGYTDGLCEHPPRHTADCGYTGGGYMYPRS